VVTISDRRVPPSFSGERTECWNGCKDEKTGDAIMTLPIIMNEKSEAGKAYMRIAKRLCGNKVPIEEPKAKKRGLVGKLKGMFS
jgi:hypothetical protein